MAPRAPRPALPLASRAWRVICSVTPRALAVASPRNRRRSALETKPVSYHSSATRPVMYVPAYATAVFGRIPYPGIRPTRPPATCRHITAAPMTGVISIIRFWNSGGAPKASARR